MRRAIALEKGEDDIWDLKHRRRRAGRYRFHRAISAAAFTPRKSPKFSASPRCRCSTTPRASACCRNRDGRNVALSGAALSRPDADPAALRQRQVQSGNRRRGSVARDGAGRRRRRISRRWRRGCGETQAEVRRVFRQILRGQSLLLKCFRHANRYLLRLKTLCFKRQLAFREPQRQAHHDDGALALVSSAAASIPPCRLVERPRDRKRPGPSPDRSW